MGKLLVQEEVVGALLHMNKRYVDARRSTTLRHWGDSRVAKGAILTLRETMRASRTKREQEMEKYHNAVKRA